MSHRPNRAGTAGFETALDILQCPRSKTPLRLSSVGELVSIDGGNVCPWRDGIACFVADTARVESAGPEIARTVREYYDNQRWQADDKGVFDDTRAFVDTRAAPLEHTHRCIARLNKYFTSKGRCLLDAGSGPIAHREYLGYSAGFAHRVCIDFSISAPQIAKSKLGVSSGFRRYSPKSAASTARIPRS